MSLMRRLFPLGRIWIKPGAWAALDAVHSNGFDLIERHQSGDWGEVSTEQAESNALAVEEGFRVLSAYTLSTGVVLWIATEGNRGLTSVMLPEEEYMALPFPEPYSW